MFNLISVLAERNYEPAILAPSFLVSDKGQNGTCGRFVFDSFPVEIRLRPKKARDVRQAVLYCIAEQSAALNSYNLRILHLINAKSPLDSKTELFWAASGSRLCRAKAGF